MLMDLVVEICLCKPSLKDLNFTKFHLSGHQKQLPSQSALPFRPQDEGPY